MKLDLSLSIGSTESTEDWVKASRERERQKLIAQQQARRLEQEEEDNVTSLGQNQKIRLNQASQYTSSHLQGLKVRHGAQAFDTEGEVILTLADTDVLATDQYGRVTGLNEDADDILENVNIAEHERKIQRDKQLKRLKQPLYKGYDDDEFDAGRIGIKQDILPHYEDEEMQKKRQRLEAKIVLGADGSADLSALTAKSLGEKLPNRQLTSLATETKLATDFLTAEEVKFRKKKQGDKKKRNTRVKLDDGEDEQMTQRAVPSVKALTTGQPMSAPGETEYDLADILGDDQQEEETSHAIADVVTAAQEPVVRRPLVAPKRQRIVAENIVFEDEDQEFANAMRRAREASRKHRLVLEESGMSFNDEDEDEQQKAVPKIVDIGAQRALQQIVTTKTAEPVQESVVDEEVDVDGRRADGTLIFNSTMQFSSRLQAVMNDRARVTAEQALRDVDMKTAQSTASLTGIAATATATAAATNPSADNGDTQRPEGEQAADGDDYSWDEFEDHDMDDDEDDGQPSEDEQMAFLHRQPLVAKGMAATLELLKGSGELQQSTKLAGRAKDSRAIDPSQMTDDKGVKLEYRDEFGRKLTQKEAFRQLSYKFHGYGPGKKKLEKRMKQRDMELKAQKVRSGVLEGAAGTMRTLTQTQEATGKAHLVVPIGTSAASAKK